MFARSLAFVVWALVAGSAVFWGFKLFVRPLAVPAQTALAAPAAVAGGDLSRLFGVEAVAPVAEAAPPPPESSRFQLIGVVAPRAAASRSQGVALIAIDGKTPRAFRVGAVVEGDLVLQSVQQRAAAIGPRLGVATVSLQLPPLPPPATGVPGAVPAPALAAPPQVQPAAQPMPAPPPQPGFAPNLAVPPQNRLRALRNGLPAGTMLPQGMPQGIPQGMPMPAPSTDPSLLESPTRDAYR